MKILKHGKVEMRKFVCPNCECVFVIYKSEANRSIDLDANYHYWAQCPCRDQIAWDKGEPYEEPAQDGRERLAQLLIDGDLQETMDDLLDRLIRNGVTFREV